MILSLYAEIIIFFDLSKVDKVSKPLSNVFATCDLFSGLDHVGDDEVEWVRTFFYEMINLVDLTSNAESTGSFKYLIIAIEKWAK